MPLRPLGAPRVESLTSTPARRSSDAPLPGGRPRIAGLVPSFFLPGAALAQEPPATFPFEAEPVVVDVVVIGAEGPPITDLSDGEIEIYEDGIRQSTTRFELIETAVSPRGAGPAGAERPAARARVSSNTDEEEGQGRTYAIVFDDAHLTKDTAGHAREAVTTFLTAETREGDWITLVAPQGGAWWNARMTAGREELLEVLSAQQGLLPPDMPPDRLTDYQAMRIHVYRDPVTLELHEPFRVTGPRALIGPREGP